MDWLRCKKHYRQVITFQEEERLSVPAACRSCPDFPVCGSGCPLSRDHDLTFCTDRLSEG